MPTARFGLPLVLLALIATVLAGPAPAGSTLAASSGAPARAADAESAVIGTQRLGRSVQGRAIKAYHLGERGKPKVLLIASMHGDEGAPQRILDSLRRGRPIRGVNLWVVPRYNPDGLVAGTRKNAHGVDLNRNFPYRWADLDGSYESGPRARSEPETRAMMRFLKTFRPGRIISFHQPLHGVDTDTKSKRFSRRVARALDLPRKSFTCGGVCHGTMTGWYNHRFRGTALTAEYGPRPSRHRMRVVAPRQVLSVIGGRRPSRP